MNPLSTTPAIPSRFSLIHKAAGAAALCLLLVPVDTALRAAEPAPGPEPAEHEDVVIERRVVVQDGGQPRMERFRDNRRDLRLGAMRERAERLHREGRHDEAEQVERAAEELERRRVPRPDRDAPRAPRDGGGLEGLQRRLNHLHIAIENLHAAGLPELALEVERRAEVTRRELEERAQRNRPEAVHDELERLRHELAEVRGQLEALRREHGPREGH